MAKVDLNKIPRFAELPVKAGAPRESSWGVFGDDDELGCLNFLTTDGVVEAARLVQKGKVFRLDTRINYAKPPLFNAHAGRHNIMSFERFGLLGHDDSLDNYNTQEGSQWDGLGARRPRTPSGVLQRRQGRRDQGRPGGKLSIHKWANSWSGAAC